jgi:Na+/melibiose symporter-like transporter
MLIFALVLLILGSVNDEGSRGFQEGLGIFILVTLSCLYQCCKTVKEEIDMKSKANQRMQAGLDAQSTVLRDG